MDYQFITIIVGFITLFFTVINSNNNLRIELTNKAEKMETELNNKMDKLEIKFENDLKTVNSRIDALNAKVDTLIMVLFKQNLNLSPPNPENKDVA